jgi:ribosomal biogenesis protein LAS1
MMMLKGIQSSLFGLHTPLLSVGQWLPKPEFHLHLERFPVRTGLDFALKILSILTPISFVTGLVDTKIHGVRRTMFQRATDLGLPASFVELRHEATHREPPSLVVLRKAAQRSLEWLWDNFWADVCDEPGATPALTHDDGASVRAALCDALQPLTGGSVEPVPKKRKRDQAVSVTMQIVSVCNVSGAGIRLLPSVLLEREVLVPAGRK